MSRLGDRLGRRRCERGFSLRELAALTGVKAQNISRVEMGSRTHIRSDTLERFADALDCSADYLLGRTDNPRLTPPPKRPRRRTAAPVG